METQDFLNRKRKKLISLYKLKAAILAGRELHSHQKFSQQEKSTQTEGSQPLEVNLPLFPFNSQTNFSFLKFLSSSIVWPFQAIGNIFSAFHKANLLGVDIISSGSQVLLSLFEEGHGFSPEELLELFCCQSPQTNASVVGNTNLHFLTSFFRLGPTFILLSKTKKEVTVCMVSVNLQTQKEDISLFLPLFVVPQGISSNIKRNCPSYKAIWDEFGFIFSEELSFFEFIDKMKQGTQIFFKNSILDGELRQIEDDIVLLSSMGNTKNLVDFSLKTYLRHLFVQSDFSLSFLGGQANMEHPVARIDQMRETFTVRKASSKGEIDCWEWEEKDWEGFFVLENSFKTASRLNFCDDAFELKSHLNGILVYCENRLVCRLGQDRLGNEAYLLKNNLKKGSIVSGFVKITNEDGVEVVDSLDYTSNSGFKKMLFEVNDRIGKFLE